MDKEKKKDALCKSNNMCINASDSSSLCDSNGKMHPVIQAWTLCN